MNKRPRILKPAAQTPALLAVNGGSSSIRFAFYEAHAPMRRIMDGKMDRIGLPGTSLAFRDLLKGTSRRLRVAANSGKAVDFLLAWLEGQPVFASVAGVGHRIVHGMAHTKPARVTPRLLGEL